MQSPSEHRHALIGRLLRACAAELDVLRQRVAGMECVVTPEVMRSPTIFEDESLQAALQEFDWISQHLEALQHLLADVAEHSSEEGESALVDALERIRLKEVAERMTLSMGDVREAGVRSTAAAAGAA